MVLMHIYEIMCFPVMFLFIGMTSYMTLFSPSITKADENSEKATIESLLDMSLEELIGVEIALPTRNPMPVSKAPAIATVITAQEIHNMGARDLMDVLKMVPGLGISRNEQGFFLFEVRGISTVTSEKILLMIDGHSINKNYVGSGLEYLADHLSVENIRQVEVVRGPGSALYGANAFVATINIITKDTLDLQGLKISLADGSYNTRKVDVLGGKNFVSGVKVSGSLDLWKTDGPDLLIAQDSLSGTPFSMAPGYADTSYDAMDLLLKLSYGEVSYEGHYIKNKRGVYIGFGSALTDGNRLEFMNFWHEMNYRKAVTQSLSTSFKLYWDQFEQDASVVIYPPGFLGTFPNGMIGGPKVKDRTIGGELQTKYDLLGNNHLLFGVLYEMMKQYDVRHISNFSPNNGMYLGSIQDISAWGNWNKDVNREIYAAYLQDEWQVTDTVDLTAGLRHDHYSDFGDTTNPRLSLVWAFMQNAELKLLYGQAFRAPNFVELYNDNNPTVLGNKDVQPEEIKTYEAAVGYRLTKSWRCDFNYFHNDIDALIVRDNSTSPARYANLGGAEVDGIELVVTGNYQRDSYWKLTYTYQDPRNSGTKARIPFVPNHRAGLSFNYGFTQDLIAHMDILWTGERPRPAGDSRPVLKSFATVDVALTLKNIFKSFEVQGTIHNLLNEKYRDPDLSGPSQVIMNDYPREGISALLRLSYKF